MLADKISELLKNTPFKKNIPTIFNLMKYSCIGINNELAPGITFACKSYRSASNI